MSSTARSSLVGEGHRERFGRPRIAHPRAALPGNHGWSEAAACRARQSVEAPQEGTLQWNPSLPVITATASMAKYWTTDLQCKVMDECVQLFGGYGYMWEYPIARAYADARVQRIYGGTNEIMKEVITRAMGLGGR